MKVFKYELFPMNEGCLVTMPRDAQPLSVGLQGSTIVCWAAVSEDAEPIAHQFFLLVTGRKFGCIGRFVGTVVVPDLTLPHGLVVHVFYGGEA